MEPFLKSRVATAVVQALGNLFLVMFFSNKITNFRGYMGDARSA